jgi:hypothetical protein
MLAQSCPALGVLGQAMPVKIKTDLVELSAGSLLRGCRSAEWIHD